MARILDLEKTWFPSSTVSLYDGERKWGMGMGGILIIIELFSPLFFYRFLPPFIPIFNQMPWGQERLGKTITIFVPVLVALLISIINLFTT